MSVVDHSASGDIVMSDEIARLEARIETLSDSIERCRKISAMAWLVLGAGAVWVVLIALRALPFAPFHLVGAIAALLGGIVLLGSNASTQKQMEAARAEAERLRADLIDRMDLQTVREDGLLADAAVPVTFTRGTPTLH